MGEHIADSSGNATMGGQGINQRTGHIYNALVERAIADGAYQDALDALVRGYQRVMVNFCRMQLGRVREGGRAEEVAQEVFLAAYQSMPRVWCTAWHYPPAGNTQMSRVTGPRCDSVARTPFQDH